MQGTIISYNKWSGEGLISGNDSQRYKFRRLEWQHKSTPAEGRKVDFETNSDDAKNIYPIFENADGKNRIVAALLALFLGGFGIHKFYLGQVIAGFIYLILCWTFIPALLGFIEFLLLIFMKDSEFNRRFN